MLVPRDPEKVPNVEALFARCRAELAHYKAPRLWYVAGTFPVTETGKLQKFRLIEAIQKGEIPLLART